MKSKLTKFVFAVALVAALFIGATSAKAYTHSMTLKMGMSNAQVMELQKALNAKGFAVSTTGAGSVGMESMYFGAKTKAAVVAFQAANGLTADGVVGPMTGSKLAGTVSGNFPAGCTSAAGYSPTTGMSCSGGSTPSTSTGPLAGTDGAINDVDTITSYNNEEVGEGESDVKVAGFEVEATNDGDIALRSIKLKIDSTGNTGSTHLDDYIEGVSVWMGNTKIGSADVEDFSENSDVYTRSITVSNAVIKSDETEKFYVTFDAVNSFDSSDIATTNDSWTVAVENIRFEDGSGVVTTDDDSGDLGSTTGIGTDGTAGEGVAVDFVSFGDSADTELVFSTDSDSPDADIVLVDDSTSTDGVVLVKGKMKLEGDSDVTIDSLPISFSPVGANINVIAESLILVIDGEEYTESVPSIADGATASVTFDDLDFTVDAGNTVEFEVRADITDMDGSIFAEGDSLEANFTSDNRDVMDAENEEGDQLSDSSEKSGTVNGDAQEFRTEGIMLTLVSTDADVTTGNSTSDDLGEFTIKFKVKANGSSVYISSLAAASLTTTGTGAIAGVERSGTATIGGVSVTIVNDTDDDLTSYGNYLIEDGEEETFIMTTTVQLPTAGAAGQYRALLRALDWSTSDGAMSGAGYTTNLDSFKTSYKALN